MYILQNYSNNNKCSYEPLTVKIIFTSIATSSTYRRFNQCYGKMIEITIYCTIVFFSTPLLVPFVSRHKNICTVAAAKNKQTDDTKPTTHWQKSTSQPVVKECLRKWPIRQPRTDCCVNSLMNIDYSRVVCCCISY